MISLPAVIGPNAFPNLKKKLCPSTTPCMAPVMTLIETGDEVREDMENTSGDGGSSSVRSTTQLRCGLLFRQISDSEGSDGA